MGTETTPVSKERSVRKMTVLGASALLVAGLMTSPAAAFAAPVAGAPAAITPSGDEATCLPKEDHVQGDGGPVMVVTAPDGFLITGYCVKAGSANQGLGPEYVEVDPPAAEVTIEHSSGKDISHYTLVTVKAEPTPEPTVPGEEPSVEPTKPGEEPTDEPTKPGEEPTVEPTDDTTPAPSGPAVEPTTDVTEPADESAAPVEDDATPSPSAAAETPGALAETGASTVIGFTLIALALVGGGVTLIVLRRKGVLGS